MPYDLERIGHVLRTAREERGLAIEQVSRALFIRKTMISALESGNWEKLPHPVYVKGYINQYAAYLNITENVQAEFAAKDEPVPAEADASAPPAREKSARKWEPKRWHPGKKAAAAALMAAVVVAFMVFLNADRAPEQTAGQPGRSAQALTPAAPSASDAPSVYKTVAATNSADEAQGEKRVLETKKLMIACQERTWVRIMIDDSEKKEFMMNPEEVVVLNAKEKFDLLIGNAGGVKLFYNGKDVGFTGETGEVKRVNLS
jgi:cytoskeletal protein RodZ